MKGKSYRKALRARRFAEDPNCYWCRRGMVLIEAGPKHKNFPPNTATLEHLKSRLDPTRRHATTERRIVLACLKCNNERGAVEIAQLSKEELHRRAGGHRDRAGADYSEVRKGRRTPIQWPPMVSP